MEVETRAEELKDVEVAAAAGDDPAEGAEEGEARDAQPVRPVGPDPRLVDERLADVEDDGPDPGRARPGADYFERSCQEVPPSGSPGSFGGLTPVRLSTCSTPRR